MVSGRVVEIKGGFMSNWIKCSERLPEFKNKAGYVLVACEGGNVDKSFFCENREYLRQLKTSGSYSRSLQGKESGFFDISHRYGYKITHWQPLPDAPGDEE